VALWHHPLYTSGVHKSDAGIEDIRSFWRPLVPAGADIVLNGHDHHYERFAPMDEAGLRSEVGIRQFVSGAGGHSLRKIQSPAASNQEKVVDDAFGYMIIDLYPGRYEWQFKSVVGEVLDSGKSDCH
jgi:hypothetical protein